VTEQIQIPNGVVHVGEGSQIAFAEPGMSPAPEDSIRKAARVTAKSKTSLKKPPVRIRKGHDPDKFLTRAKEVVCDNYNQHRDKSRLPSLLPSAVDILWFTRTSDDWQAICTSSVARGILWEVSFDGETDEIHLNIYKRLNTVTISKEM